MAISGGTQTEQGTAFHDGQQCPLARSTPTARSGGWAALRPFLLDHHVQVNELRRSVEDLRHRRSDGVQTFQTSWI